MRRTTGRLARDTKGAVAPTVGLSLFALIAAGGLAFDYAQMASLDTELQQAADQAALAAATQLDGQTNARARGTAAAHQLVSNLALFANRGQTRTLNANTDFTVTFCSAYDDDLSNAFPEVATAPTGCTLATGDADAKIAVVTMAGRTAHFALTPIVGALNSGNLTAQAAAHVGSAICKVPPVMICNPDEPVGNTNELLDFNPARGTGLRLVTGNATVPGNFGWLEAGLGNGTQALAGELGYNTPQGPCQAITGVSTKTGMDTAVLNAYNTRFDVYANGNTTCPSQGGGICSPSVNTRKDLTCEEKNGACKNDTWNPVTYDPPFVGGVAQTLGSAATPVYPAIMGYPHDLCHSGRQSQHTCGIKGSAVWDANAYFQVNYGWDEATWRSSNKFKMATGIPARWDVYQWEIANPNFSGKGINNPQNAGSGQFAFARPATGRAGVAQGTSQPDRRTIAVATLNCRALEVKGKTTNVPVSGWLKVFLVEPAIKRGTGSDLYADTKDIYVEFVEKSQVQDDDFSEVVRRDVPYLIK
ncbi:MAG: pilus assembly protein TadG-related protein [Sphingomicrobium sp.]